MMGLLYVDKPAGISSHDVVSIVRRAARTRRVGHAGTLDPFATGLLVVAVGGCTRLLPYIDGEPKVYEARVRFGNETNTDDATGIESHRAPLPIRDSVARGIAELTGAILQTPPAFSAKHVDGQRAYAVARRGGEVTLSAVPVVVHQWDVLAQTSDTIDVRITCAGGTYVRALARDLGRASNSAAHCETLRRIASGAAHIANAVPIETLRPGAIVDGDVQLRSPIESLHDVVLQQLDAAEQQQLTFGRAIPATVDGARAALVSGTTVLAIAERTTDANARAFWQPRVVIAGAT